MTDRRVGGRRRRLDDVSAGPASAVTVSVSVGEVTVPFEAEATFVTEPESRSAWVIVYDAVQVIDAAGARLAVAGQAHPSPCHRLTVNGPDNVTLPRVGHQIAVRDHRTNRRIRRSASPSSRSTTPERRSGCW